jgi:coenzyme F420 hydrogenase subunit beta
VDIALAVVCALYSLMITNLKICPFSGASPNENAIAQNLFAQSCDHHDLVGYYRGLYAGYVRNTGYRNKGSSGGLTSWFLEKALDTKLVDGVIHVQPTTKKELLFEYSIAYSASDLRKGRKSHYYPIELSQILRQVLADNYRYAVVGVPCFIKAIRLGQIENPEWQEKFSVLVGLVCGHLKSDFYARMLAWQLGIPPDELTGVDFRVKLAGHSANSYGFKAVDFRGVEQVQPITQLFGVNWGHGLFKYQACDYCDDIVGETADISFGDAWLPEYVHDEHGTNIVIVRNSHLQQLLLDSLLDGEIHLDEIGPNKIVKSQEGSYRHRREGLAYRLYLVSKQGKWAPSKRVSPSKKISTARFRHIVEMRVALREQSFIQFRKTCASGNWQDFPSALNPFLYKYQYLYRSPFHHRLRNLATRLIKSFKNKLLNLIFPK